MPARNSKVLAIYALDTRHICDYIDCMYAATSEIAPQRAMSSVNRKPQVRPQKASRTAARDIVIASRAAGMSLEECAKAAAVSLKTASRYVAEARNASGDLSRDRIISMLSLRLSSPGTPDQYIAPLVAILSKLKGWTDKEQQVERVMPMGDLFASWAAEIASNVGAPTMPHSETVGVSEPVGPNAGEPPIGGVVGSVKSSPPPRTEN